ncbi:hypothetical protein [Methanocalculus sp. MC3]
MKTDNTTPIPKRQSGYHIYNDISPHAPPSEKILNALLIISIRDPISFNLIHPRHLKSPGDWIRFVDYAVSSPTRDGIGFVARQAMIKYLASCDINDITRREAVLLTKVARPHSDQIPNLKPLFERIRIWEE